MNDEKRESTFRGWILLCVMAIAFPPSKNFEDYLKSFVSQGFSSKSAPCSPSNSLARSSLSNQQQQQQQQKRISVVAKHLHRSLVRICKSGARGKVPSVKEIERAQVCRFYLLSFRVVSFCGIEQPDTINNNLGFNVCI